MRRRRFLALAASGTALTAGCIGDTGGNSIEQDVFERELSDIPEYEGPTDRRGQDEVTIKVGAMEEADYLRFDPMGVVVTEGTTILWEWTGNGGEHQVVNSDEITVKSELTAEAGYTWEMEYNQIGVTEYLCAVHERDNMIAAIAGRSPNES